MEYFVPVCDVSPFCQHACDEHVIHAEDAAIALLVHLNICELASTETKSTGGRISEILFISPFWSNTHSDSIQIVPDLSWISFSLILTCRSLYLNTLRSLSHIFTQSLEQEQLVFSPLLEKHFPKSHIEQLFSDRLLCQFERPSPGAACL